MTACPHCGGALLGAADAAARVGVTRSTWESYVARGQAPAPALHAGASPVWTEAQIDEWLARRPGRGVGGAASRTKRRHSRAATDTP